jgi:hypothetical protein
MQSLLLQTNINLTSTDIVVLLIIFAIIILAIKIIKSFLSKWW